MAPRRGPGFSLWELLGDLLFSELTPEGITKLEGGGLQNEYWVGPKLPSLPLCGVEC